MLSIYFKYLVIHQYIIDEYGQETMIIFSVHLLFIN